jgi:branched-chain amino acid transport system substrate-binding protein
MTRGFMARVLLLVVVGSGVIGCAGSGSGSGGTPADCGATGGCASFKPGEPIKIGVGGPMTGANSAFGIDALQAAQLAVKDAGTFDGHTFGVVRGDDLATDAGVVAAANSLTADPAVVAVVGHSFSGQSDKGMTVYAAKFVPMMSPSSTRVSLTQQQNPAFNRLVSTDMFQGNLGATFMLKNLGAKSVAILHDGTPYGQGLAESVRDSFEAGGGTVGFFEAIAPGEPDYSGALKKVAKVKPDAVYFGGYAPEAGVLAAQKGAAGLSVPFVSGDGVFGSQFVSLAGDSAEGYYVTQPGAPLSDQRTKFDAAYLAQFGKAAGSLTGYTWFAYDATNVLILGIEKVAIQSGDTLYVPRKALMAAIRSTRAYPGLTGVVTCLANGECATAPTFVVFQVKQGAFVQLPSDYKP